MSIISFTMSNTSPTFTLKGKSKRGIKKIMLLPTQLVNMDGTNLEANKQFIIEFPELNGKLPQTITLTAPNTPWYCGFRILELGGEGYENYFKIKKENDNGVPT